MPRVSEIAYTCPSSVPFLEDEEGAKTYLAGPSQPQHFSPGALHCSPSQATPCAQVHNGMHSPPAPNRYPGLHPRQSRAPGFLQAGPTAGNPPTESQTQRIISHFAELVFN